MGSEKLAEEARNEETFERKCLIQIRLSGSNYISLLLPKESRGTSLGSRHHVTET